MDSPAMIATTPIALVDALAAAPDAGPAVHALTHVRAGLAADADSFALMRAAERVLALLVPTPPIALPDTVLGVTRLEALRRIAQALSSRITAAAAAEPLPDDSAGTAAATRTMLAAFAHTGSIDAVLASLRLREIPIAAGPAGVVTPLGYLEIFPASDRTDRLAAEIRSFDAQASMDLGSAATMADLLLRIQIGLKSLLGAGGLRAA